MEQESSCSAVLPVRETLEHGGEAYRGGQMNKSRVQFVTFDRTVCVLSIPNVHHKNWILLMNTEIGSLWQPSTLCLTSSLFPVWWALFRYSSLIMMAVQHTSLLTTCTPLLPLGMDQDFLTPYISPASTVPSYAFPLNFRSSPHLWPKTIHPL